MKFYRCDICGKEIDPKDAQSECGKTNFRHPGLFGDLVENKDVCGNCMVVGKSINFEKELIQLWKNKAVKKESIKCMSDETAKKFSACNAFHVDFGSPLCYGTKEIEPCKCDGNKINCDFYPEYRSEGAERGD